MHGDIHMDALLMVARFGWRASTTNGVEGEVEAKTHMRQHDINAGE